MALRIRTALGGLGRDGSTWLMPLFLVLGVLVPTACVLWFMNEAASIQADAARRSVAEACGGQLRLVRDRLDSAWRDRAEALQDEPGRSAEASFRRALTRSGADAVVLLDSKGAPRYPSWPPVTPVQQPDAGLAAEWHRARVRESTAGRLSDAAAATGGWRPTRLTRPSRLRRRYDAWSAWETRRPRSR